jgi:glycosyltransferase involved in cell wall biosynthesis
MPYIESTLHTITPQLNPNIELILSDSGSTDGTKGFLQQYASGSNVKYYEAPSELNMLEHWEWALKKAQGRWVIFVGQDDGLLPYFSTLSEKLINIAETKKIQIISSSRAYYFWEGTQNFYGDVQVSYQAIPVIKIKKFYISNLKTLLNISTYFELPQMYTSSLFKQEFIQDIRELQNGKFLTCHPQDANIASISVRAEKNYLMSLIPLGWVGSSIKSAGLSVEISAGSGHRSIEKLKLEYLSKIMRKTDNLELWNDIFDLNDDLVYYFNALTLTSNISNKTIEGLINSITFRYLIFTSVVLKRFIQRKPINSPFFRKFERVNLRFDCNIKVVYLLFGISVIPVIFTCFILIILKKIKRYFEVMIRNRVFFSWTHQRSVLYTMDQCNYEIMRLVQRDSRFLNKFERIVSKIV